MEKIRTAVVGAGKMGGFHSRVYSELDYVELVGIADLDMDKATALAEKYSCKAFGNPAELVGKVDAVTISAPTIHHLELAEMFIGAGIAVLIEKPLAATIEQGQRIVDLAAQKNVIAAVGHSERCNPVVQAMKRLEIEPRYIQVNRISPYTFRSTDIGVVLDIMIHDIDIILSLAGSKVKKVDAVGVNVLGVNEDICNARIFFENGCVANITSSRLALKTERKIRVFSRQAYLSLDYLKKEGIAIKAAPNVNVVEWVREKQEEGTFDFNEVNWPDLLHIEPLMIEDKEPLKVEQEAFLHAVMGKSERPEVTAAEGLEALKCAHKILEAIKEHNWE
jgi:predicted dehydrogenase